MMWTNEEGQRVPLTCSGDSHRFGLIRDWETRTVERECACGLVRVVAEHIASDHLEEDRWLVEVHMEKS